MLCYISIHLWLSLAGIQNKQRQEILKWHECANSDCLLPSWPQASSTPPICTSACTLEHACTHTSIKINAPTHLHTKCSVIPCDPSHMTSFSWQQHSACVRTLLDSTFDCLSTLNDQLAAGLTGMLASCLSDWVDAMQVEDWFTGFLAGNLIGEKVAYNDWAFSVTSSNCYRFCMWFCCCLPTLDDIVCATTIVIC